MPRSRGLTVVPIALLFSVLVLVLSPFKASAQAPTQSTVTPAEEAADAQLEREIKARFNIHPELGAWTHEAYLAYLHDPRSRLANALLRSIDRWPDIASKRIIIDRRKAATVDLATDDDPLNLFGRKFRGDRVERDAMARAILEFLDEQTVKVDRLEAALDAEKRRLFGVPDERAADAALAEFNANIRLHNTITL